MQKIFLCIIFATLVCVNAQENFQLYDQLPERTLVLWRAPDVATSRDAMKGSALYKLFNEPEVQNFVKKTIDPYKDHLHGTINQVSQVLGMPAEKAIAVLHGEVVLAVVDVDPRRQSVGAVLSIEFGENREAIDALLNLAKQASGFTFDEEQHDGHTVYSVQQMPPHMKVSYAIVQDTLLISSQNTLLKELISGSEGARLKDAANIKTVSSKVHRAGVAAELLYLNVEQAMKQFSPMMPPQAMPMMEKLGVAGIKSLGMGVNIDGDNINVDFYLHSPGEKNGVMSVFDLKPTSMEALKYMPKHSVGVSLMRFDMVGLLNKVKATLEDIAPDGSLLQMYEHMMGEIERELGFDFENGLFDTLGTELYGCNYMPATGGLLPRSLGAVTLKNEAEFWRIANEMATKGDLSIKKLEFAGKTIHYVSQNVGELFNFRTFQALPKLGNFSGQALMVENGTLYIAGSVQDMKSFIEERSSWKENIDNNVDFQQLKKFLPAEASFVTYLDVRPMFNYVWNTMIPILRSFEGIIRKAGVEFSTANLPQATTISRHLKPFLMSYASDKDGLLMSYTSPMTFIIPVAGATGVGTAIAIPLIEEQKKKARQVMIKSNLRNILSAQQMYKVDRMGYGSFTDLTQKNYTYNVYNYDSGVFMCGDYYLYMYRATADGEVTEEGAESNRAHHKFVIYAWPASYEDNTVYAMNEKGEIVSTQTRQYYDLDMPKANAAFAADAENASKLEGSFASGSAGQDANIWNSVD
ncbi:DUF3352 domain-containing protein [Candidatus Uabimicrobium amorphum]|uniref:DUF3352 domain-containing protein n=1 Tax=Uabimicrobium amorphum TaxID=2596890 RepID=A0A5S9IQU0_UABAM|nr:DUF3352 domain-containing protein [Candidatus Uabimicrobium amorphum]BBM86027.1 hypothetical protein UABAM_04413 [Candidatus Uabimicrobium amorphum]